MIERHAPDWRNFRQKVSLEQTASCSRTSKPPGIFGNTLPPDHSGEVAWKALQCRVGGRPRKQPRSRRDSGERQPISESDTSRKENAFHRISGWNRLLKSITDGSMSKSSIKRNPKRTPEWQAQRRGTPNGTGTQRGRWSKTIG